MKSVFVLVLIVLFEGSVFSADIDKLFNGPPQHNMADQFQSGISDVRVSPAPFHPNPGSVIPSPFSSEQASCLAKLKSLNSLIDTSLWTLYLSKHITDQALSGSCRSSKASPKPDLTPSLSESIEQIYASSIDEIDHESTSIGGKIADTLKTGDDHLFHEFTNFFHRSTENQKSGLSTLAMKIEECLNQGQCRAQSPDPNHDLSPYLAELKKIISEANSIQVSFDQYQTGIPEMIGKYGVLAAAYYSDALHELIETGKKDEFKEKSKFAGKALDLYSRLNQEYCFPKPIRANVTAVYSKAEDARNNGKYSEAIGLYQQVISMDSTYASQNGCYNHIGDCYRALKQYSDAISNYKQSIAIDATDPYKRNSYTSGLAIYTYDLPAIEDNYLKAIAFQDDVRKLTNDQVILQNIGKDRAGIYEKLGSMESLDHEKRIGYYKQSGEEWVKYTDQFPTAVDASDALWNGGQCFTYSTGSPQLQSLLADQKEEREKCYLRGIEIYRRLRSDYPAYYRNNEALFEIGQSYGYIGFMDYLTGKPYYIVLQKKAEYCLKAVDAFRQFVTEYPNDGSYIMGARAGIATNFAHAASYYEDQLNLQEIEHYYQESNSAWQDMINHTQVDYYNAYGNQRIGDNCKILARDFRGINGNLEKQKEYADKAISAYGVVSGNEANDTIDRGLSMLYCGDVCMDLKDFDKAIGWYDQVIDKFAAGSYGLYLAGYGYIFKGDCLYEKGRSAEGKAACQKFYDFGAAPGDLPSYYIRADLVMGKCEYGLQDYTGAIASLDKVQSYSLNPSEDIMCAAAYLFHGKCKAGQGNYSAAHQDLAKVVSIYSKQISYNQDHWWFDDTVISAKDEISKVVKVKIDPMVETISQGESKTFTATLVYTDDTPALLPSGSIKEWKWEESGNEGDGHVINFTGNTATYKGGSGDFQDTILTAKALINGGSYGTRAVPSDVWVEGDNQLPVCLVNENGVRIISPPIFIPDDGVDKGLPPNSNDPLDITVFFHSQYTTIQQDELTVSFLSPDTLGEMNVSLMETGPDTHVFQSANGSYEITIYNPLPAPPVTSKATKKKTGTEKMNLDFKVPDKVLHFELPIWLGPGISKPGANNLKENYFYMASNRVFFRGSCAKIDQTEYVPLNSKVYVEVIDDSAQGDFVNASLTSNNGKQKDLQCKKIKPKHYRSEPFFIIPQDFSPDEIYYRGKNYPVIKVDLANSQKEGGLGPFFHTKYHDFDKIAYVKKAAYAVFAKRDTNSYPFSKWNFNSICDSLDKLGYQVLRDYSPTREEINQALKYSAIIFIFSHGRGNLETIPQIPTSIAVYETNDSHVLGTSDQNYYKPEDVPDLQTNLDLVCFSFCWSGIGGTLKNWNDKLKSKCIMGWDYNNTGWFSDGIYGVNKGEVLGQISLSFYASFFSKFLAGDRKLLIKKAAEDALFNSTLGRWKINEPLLILPLDTDIIINNIRSIR
ncbi:MAG: tetratricopeptide repeat protein [Candidatus Wallbacteria bacterium]|nr:tetratricopeptide repeat protein [Candidatus Wallbacteria bacterium]